MGPHKVRTAASSSRATSREPTSASSTPYIALARASVPMATSRMPNVGRQPNRRRMVAPRANRSCGTGTVPLPGSRCTPTPSCLNSRASGMGAPCKVTGYDCRSLIRHELDCPALASWLVSTSQTAVRSTTTCESGIPCAPGQGSSVMARVSSRYPRGIHPRAPGPAPASVARATATLAPPRAARAAAGAWRSSRRRGASLCQSPSSTLYYLQGSEAFNVLFTREIHL